MPAAMKKRVRAKVQLLDESAAGDGIGQPLHVRISGSTADQLLCDPSSDDGTLALVSPENVALFPGLFVNYTIVDDGKPPVAAAEHLSSGGCVELIVTQEFQRRHPKWVHNEAVVDVLCGVRCPRLAKVSLLARSADAYEKLNGPSLWEALGGGEWAERSAGGILCRMDDSLATFEGDSVLVVDCEPTRQGLIVPETQVPPLSASGWKRKF